MSISREEFDMLRPGDRILLKNNIEGSEKDQDSEYVWMHFVGDWLTVMEIKHSDFEYGYVLCFESHDEENNVDVAWFLRDIEEIDSCSCPVFNREDDISLLFC